MQIKSERLTMRVKKIVFVAIALVLLFAFGLSATGQTTGGAVTGKVVDAQGAAIPNATVKLLDKEKGQTLTTQTTDTGSYNFPNVGERSAGVQGSGGTVGGTRARGDSFTVDGVDNNDPVVTAPVIGIIQDTVQEFTLLANNYSAEFGAGAGGQFNTVTRTGTNE